MPQLSIYKDFIDHTNLTDPMYETVFIRVQELLSRINNIKWLYLSYTDKESGSSSVVNFNSDTTVPLYIIELLKNAFGDYYTLPKLVVVTIGVMFNNIEYTIVCSNEETSIPDELLFLKDGDIFNLFFLTHPVRDIFTEYDHIFNFVTKFKTNISTIHPALEKKFNIKSSQQIVDTQGINNNELMADKILIEQLEEKMRKILLENSNLKIEQENIQNEKKDIFSLANNRDTILQDKEKIENEYSAIMNTKEEYDNRVERLNTIIQEIDSSLSCALDKNGDPEEIRYLQDKKLIFDHDRTSAEKAIQDLSMLLRTALTNLEIINNNMKRIDSLTTLDVEVIDKRLAEIDALQSSTITEMLTTENKLKNLKSKYEQEQLTLAHSQDYTDVTIQSLENNSIVSHLSSPLQPASVIVASNYLRYYFCYYVTASTNDLIKINPNENIYTLQALATRICLMNLFGTSFNTLFSVFPIEHENIKKLIIITKE